MLSDPADELVFLAMPQFAMKRLESVEQWAKNEGLDNTDKSQSELIRDTSKKEFLDWLKSSLGPIRVNDIKLGGHQSEHPFVLTISTDMSAARHMLRISGI